MNRSLLRIFLIKGVLAVYILTSSASGQELYSGTNYNVFICPDSVITVWGTNYDGILAAGHTDSAIMSNTVDTMGLIKHVWTGKRQVVVQRQDGTFWTWGRRFFDIRGDDDIVGTDCFPVPIELPSTVAKLSFGESHVAVLHADGSVTTWGAGSFGRLGNGSESSSFDTFQNVPILDVVDVVCGQYHCLVLKRDGTLWTWGMNASGSLGIARLPDRSLVPVQVDSIPPIAKISVGWSESEGPSHTTVLDRSGSVWTWGYNAHGALGNGTTAVGRVPRKLTSMPPIADVASGAGFSCALDSAGRVWIWGTNGRYEMGVDVGKFSTTPRLVGGLATVTDVHTGDFHTMVRTKDNGWWGWGWNAYGQILPSNPTLYLPITQVPISCLTTTVQEQRDPTDGGEFYPNPTSGLVHIVKADGQAHTYAKSIVSTMNVNGEVLPVAATESDRTIDVDLSGCSDGVYFIMINYGSAVRFFKLSLIR